MTVEAQNAVHWSAEFSRVISCERCDAATCKKLLRDVKENVPQPGFIGARYWEHRIVLVGQNPGITRAPTASDDRRYTEALRRVRDEPSEATWESLRAITREFIPRWPVHGNHFPLKESGLTLDQIAYFNIVRCRTIENAPPSARMVELCRDHLDRWLDLLRPRGVIFIGKWASVRGEPSVKAHGALSAFMNRERSLSSADRMENRRSVVEFVRRLAS